METLGSIPWQAHPPPLGAASGNPTPRTPLRSELRLSSHITPAHQAPTWPSYHTEPFRAPTLQHSFISRLHSLARIPKLQNLMKHSRVFLARISICSWQQQGQRVLIIAPTLLMDFPSGSGSKKSTCNVGDLGSIPGSGRSLG